MATEESGNIDDLAAIICKDALELRNFKGKCLEFLTKVFVPGDWEDRSYRLTQEHPTYTYRKKLLTTFIEEQKSKGVMVIGTKSKTSITTENFFELLEKFSELQETNDSFPEFANPGYPALIDLFDKNLKLQGVVVRKSDTKLCVLIKRELKGGRKQHANSSLTEHIIDVKGEPDGGYCFKVGDIVEVTKCRRKDKVALEPEVIK